MVGRLQQWAFNNGPSTIHQQPLPSLQPPTIQTAAPSPILATPPSLYLSFYFSNLSKITDCPADDPAHLYKRHASHLARLGYSYCSMLNADVQTLALIYFAALLIVDYQTARIKYIACQKIILADGQEIEAVKPTISLVQLQKIEDKQRIVSLDQPKTLRIRKSSEFY